MSDNDIIDSVIMINQDDYYLNLLEYYLLKISGIWGSFEPLAVPHWMNLNPVDYIKILIWCTVKNTGKALMA